MFLIFTIISINYVVSMNCILPTLPHHTQQVPNNPSVVFDNQSALQQFRGVELANPIIVGGGGLYSPAVEEDGGNGPLSPAANSISASTNQERVGSWHIFITTNQERVDSLHIFITTNLESVDSLHICIITNQESVDRLHIFISTNQERVESKHS